MGMFETLACPALNLESGAFRTQIRQDGSDAEKSSKERMVRKTQAMETKKMMENIGKERRDRI